MHIGLCEVGRNMGQSTTLRSDTMMEDVMPITVLHLRNAKGRWYRKTLQYGYDRQQGIDRWMGMRLNGLDPWPSDKVHSQEIYADMYACGFLGSHYPMPARLD